MDIMSIVARHSFEAVGRRVAAGKTVPGRCGTIAAGESETVGGFRCIWLHVPMKTFPAAPDQHWVAHPAMKRRHDSQATGDCGG